MFIYGVQLYTNIVVLLPIELNPVKGKAIHIPLLMDKHVPESQTQTIFAPCQTLATHLQREF